MVFQFGWASVQASINGFQFTCAVDLTFSPDPGAVLGREHSNDHELAKVRMVFSRKRKEIPNGDWKGNEGSNTSRRANKRASRKKAAANAG